MIIEPNKMRAFPCVKPVIDGETIYRKNVHKICGRPAFKTEKNTMSTLSDAMMLTLFIASTK
jgi:hypothetical protein